MLPAAIVFFAVLGGLGWAIGSVGKRYGVEATDAEKIVGCAVLNVCYCFAGVVVPTLALFTQSSSSNRAAYDNPEWQSRLLVVCGLGIVSVIGCLMSIHAYAIAKDTENSAVTAMVMNSVFIVCSPLILATCFHGAVSALTCVALLLVLAGTLTLDPYCVAWVKGDTDETSLLVNSDDAGKGSVSSICFSVVAALCWCCGPLARRYAIPDDVPEEQKVAMSIITNTFMSGAGFLCVFFWALLCVWQNQVELSNKGLQRRAPIVLVAGGLSGIGGTLVTYAMSLARSSDSPLILTISNATFNLLVPLALALIYLERISNIQACGASLILAGVLLVIDGA